MPGPASPIGLAKRAVRDAQRVVVLTGAGISTDSGIPDFRGPNGVWTKNPAAEKAATLQHYLADPEVRRRAWQHRAATRRRGRAEPNAGHRALVELERPGKLLAVVTQNVDGLHQQAGHRSRPGGRGPRHDALDVVCWSCGDRAADGARRSTGCGPARTTRACRGVRRHPQVGDDLASARRSCPR